VAKLAEQYKEAEERYNKAISYIPLPVQPQVVILSVKRLEQSGVRFLEVPRPLY
jgi:hypothetical protein